MHDCDDAVKHESTLEDIHLLFCKAQLISRHEEVPCPTPLCHNHYQLIYNIHNPWQTKINCATCGISLHRIKGRLCPSPEVVEALLNEMTEYDYKISKDDKVCLTCYKSHLALLNNDTAVNDLASSIAALTEEIPATDTIVNETDIIDYALARTTIDIGQILLQREALLVSAAQDIQ